jgi:hypoxanthine phosphoribosyltransferase
MYRVPSYYRELYTKEEIATQTATLGSRINTWVSEVKKQNNAPVVALCMLRGAVFFFADLIREIPQDIQAEFCRLQSYDQTSNKPLSDTEIPPIEISSDIRGRNVLLIDDICDKGRVLNIMVTHLNNLGARTIKTAVMVYRDTPSSEFTPDYHCFKLQSEEWLVGMGFDDKDTYRNLPSIYAIQK